jgi:2-(1,2-epoxy-1,2-dihydrophenyl)acetyl-CoA isomerase
MNNTECILTSYESGVYKIILNRPESHNALSKKLLEELKQAIDQAETHAETRVVIITAAGSKAFSSGADLKEGLSSGQMTKMSESLTQFYNPVIRGIRESGKPYVCALNGIAAGAGCSIALACDIIIASESASLSQIFIKIGLVPDAGSSYFIPKLVGNRNAFELFTSGRIIQAEECLSLGLINELVAPEQLEDRCQELANFYKESPTKAIGLIKKMINQAGHSTLDQMLQLEAEYQDLASLTSDAGEGIMAFLQKRKASFKGK